MPRSRRWSAGESRRHQLKCLLLKDTGFDAITGDLAFRVVFSLVTMGLATRMFRRTL